MTDLQTYVLERTFDASRELVWRTWTEPEFLARWYGPNVETIVHQLDVRPGGKWLNEKKWGDNSHYQRVEYTEVTPPERLVWLHAVSDADWNISANPMMPDWPRILLTTVSFADTDGALMSGTTFLASLPSFLPNCKPKRTCISPAVGNQ